jgi:penicillin-binding protein 2
MTRIWRLPWVPGVVAMAFALGAAGSAGDDIEPASRVYWRRLPAPRGRILDRHGIALAEQRRAFDIHVVPGLFDTEARARLVDLLQLDEAELAEVDQRIALREPDRAVIVLEDQGRERADLIAVSRFSLGGAVEVHDDSRRVYRQGEVAAHVIGYVDGDPPVGRHGVERAFERTLGGQAGIEHFQLDADGERASKVEPPVAGNDVILTIDLRLQKAAEEAMAGFPAGAAVVVEVETGRILALVSTPSFDPGAAGRLAALPVDRAVAQALAPASTFKLITAIAGLRYREVELDDTVTCTGERAVGKRILRDMGSHGTVDFLTAVQRSCNVYFWGVAERVGMGRLIDVARDFGLGARTGLDIDGEVAGRLPQPSESLVATLLTAIGSGEVKVTPLQSAMAYAALANGGRLYEPQIVRRVQSPLGLVLEDREPILRRTIDVPPAALVLVREGMRRAVNEPGGTAFAAHRGAVPMAGKTGTTDIVPGGEVPHAWFAGWAPVVAPRIAVVVLVENGGVGGAVAAPVARDIVDAWFTRARR